MAWAHTSGGEAGEDLALLDNVQFIYELALAELELESFEVDFQLKNELRQFALRGSIDAEKLRRRLAYFKYVKGVPTDYYKVLLHNRTNSVNQYLTHWIYPYKGKFHPQMVRALLNILKLKPGERVLDPFVGSGTTAIEAQLLGIDCVGVDVSPLCVLQGNVKTQSVLHVGEIDHALARVKGKLAEGTLGGLNISSALSDIPSVGVKNFYRMAELVAVSDTERRGRDLVRSFNKAVEQMIESVKDYAKAVEELGLTLGTVKITEGDARKLPLEDKSVHGIITSPPYSIALDYVANDAHSLRELGSDPEAVREDFIGVRGKGPTRVGLYNADMTKSLEEMHRVLKPGRSAAIVIGNATYLGEEIRTVEFVTEHASKLGFELVKNVDKIIFGLYNVMQKENILIFRKL